jgi:heat shock protein HslJ
MNTRRLCAIVIPLLLAAPAAQAAGGSSPPLRGTVWQLGPQPAPGRQPVHIRLDEKEPRLSGYGGCNRLIGSFTLDGPRLRFDSLGGSRRACADEEAEGGGEPRFMAALAQVRAWRIEGGALKLLADSGAPVLELRPGKAVP